MPIRLRLEQLAASSPVRRLRLAQPAELSVAPRAPSGSPGSILRLGEARLQAVGRSRRRTRSRPTHPRRVAARACSARFGGPRAERPGDRPPAAERGGRQPARQPRSDVNRPARRQPGLRRAAAGRGHRRGRARRSSSERRPAAARASASKPLILTAELPADRSIRSVPVRAARGGRAGRSTRRGTGARAARRARRSRRPDALGRCLTAKLAVTGTVGAPQVDGDLEVTDGAYANGTTGTVLRDLILAARRRTSGGS